MAVTVWACPGGVVLSSPVGEVVLSRGQAERLQAAMSTAATALLGVIGKGRYGGHRATHAERVAAEGGGTGQEDVDPAADPDEWRVSRSGRVRVVFGGPQPPAVADPEGVDAGDPPTVPRFRPLAGLGNGCIDEGRDHDGQSNGVPEPRGQWAHTDRARNVRAA
ncbi:hypothetical protein H0B56_17035 [Haloechinothrix sp. YIM 98757]|uniref:Uncharacterized protein n=1 Tax=Haloechinothrix aidingensis TaxID=2752311 RepID=A0A838ADI9_9PSEU|nr:hypothetical protein [Haloechinothrix aidingensis]MBA0127257.1 hypothetical protein [Haloechinothrix aidingensis]